MKVAFFIAEYRSFTGSQRSLLDTIRAWQQGGGEAIALFPGEGLCSQMYQQKGIPTLVLPAPPSLHRFQRQLLGLPTVQKLRIWLTEVLPYSWRVGRVLKEQGCRLLHTNSTRGNLISSWIPRWMGFPIVMHIHGKQVERGLLWGLAQRLAHRIVLVAQHLKSEISPSYHSKIRVLYNAVIPSEIESLSLASLDSLPRDSRPLIVSFASLVPGKGVHHLVRAASLVVREYPALFVVAGGTPDVQYSEYVKKLAWELCPHHFLFISYLTNPYPLLRQAQVVVLPTIAVPEEVPTDNPIAVPVGEGLPRSFLEAMAMGKPVVGTRIEGASEVLGEGEAGYLVPPADPEAMASAILEVLKSPSLREQMGQKGRQRVQELFCLERHQKVLSDIYAELLSL